MFTSNAEKIPPVVYSLETNKTHAIFQFSADVKSISKLKLDVRKCWQALIDSVGTDCHIAIENTDADMVLNIPEGNDQNIPEFYKVAVLGPSTSGKSSLVDGFVGNLAGPSKVKMNLDVKYKDVILNGNALTLQLWDTGRNISYTDKTGVFLKGTVGIVLTVDLTSDSGLKETESFIREYISRVTDFPKVPMVLVGTKSDVGKVIPIARQHIQDFAEKWGIPYMECSAMTEFNVSHVFETLAKMIFAKQSPHYVCRIRVTPHNPELLSSSEFKHKLERLLSRNIIPSCQTPSSFFKEKTPDKLKTNPVSQCFSFFSQMFKKL